MIPIEQIVENATKIVMGIVNWITIKNQIFYEFIHAVGKHSVK